MISASVPLVTIAIPTHNRPQGLARTLDRAIRQDYPNIEILISDNASQAREEVQRVINDFKIAGRKISFHRQEENIGPFSNFEFLFGKATGEFVMLWPDDDDYSDESLISQLVESFAGQPDAAAAMPIVETKNYEGERVGMHTIPPGLDRKNRFFRSYTYFVPGVTDMLFYGMFRTVLVRSFRFPTGTYCPEKFLIFHILSSGPVLYCGAILTNIHVPKSFSDVEKMVGVPVNLLRHDIKMLGFLLANGTISYRVMNVILYILTQAKYTSWPMRKIRALMLKTSLSEVDLKS